METGSGLSSYDLNGGLTRVVPAPCNPPVTMSYDKENRLTVYQSGPSVAAPA